MSDISKLDICIILTHSIAKKFNLSTGAQYKMWPLPTYYLYLVTIALINTQTHLTLKSTRNYCIENT